ncbi:MAG: ATP-binding protein [Elainellaceae cyanobacterium]
MTSSSHLPLSPTDSIRPRFVRRSGSPPPKPDLLLIQDETGCYCSIYWRNAEEYGVKLDDLVGQAPNEQFEPVSIAPYLNRIRHVLNCLTPDQFNYTFRVGDRYLVFDLVVSPLLVPNGEVSQVTVIGHYLHSISRPEAIALTKDAVQISPGTTLRSYQSLLTRVAWNIRRTLDLETIWQHTVHGLGNALNASRCLICSYKPGGDELTVVGEYRHPSLKPMLNHVFSLDDAGYLQQALDTIQPIVFSQASEDCNGSPDCGGPPCPAIAVATSYQDEANGLIIIWQSDCSRPLSGTEVEIIQEFADQVGTGIAHATLFAESRDLAIELQQANENLIQKHHELEEAHKNAEEASRLKSEFLANTSHELRTPLNAMIGFLKLVLDGMADDPEEQQEFINEAYRSAVHLLNIINDILDIARIEAGKMQLEMNPVKLDELLTDLENFTRTQAEQKQLSYEILLPATRDQVILYGNYQRLLQVMLNLVGNAIKFTHQGGITITAEVAEKQDPAQPSMVKISVADTGIGVSLEDQDKLFQSFSQVDGSRTRRFGGSGLGLVISQKLVEAMGGVVNFFSLGEGLGSTVTFTVPLYQEPVIVDDIGDVDNPAEESNL